jgi:hypothetical protein
MNMLSYETLKKLIDQTKRKEPSYIYLDETDNKIKEKPLKLDSSASAYININRTYNTNTKTPAKLNHDSIFG